MLKLLKELAELVDGSISGDPDTRISGAADIADAKGGDIVFAESPKLLVEAERSHASAIITFADAQAAGKPMLLVSNPRLAFAKVLGAFSPPKEHITGIHPGSFIGEGTTIGENPSIGYNVYIGKNTTIGNNVSICPFAFIDDNVQIGDNCIIHPSVTIHDKVTLGSGVVVHSGSVIGSDGFGYIQTSGRHHKIPQIGSVVIGDDVEIGANVTIDRARTGKTEIGRGTKIDNLVHVAHNVVIGENSMIVAQVGIAGSARIGDRVTLAGQAGIKDHVDIGSDSIICAQAGVIGNVDPGQFLSGYPAGPHREQMKLYAAQHKLPGLLRVIRDLERRVKELEDRSE